VATAAWPIFDVAQMAEEASDRAGVEFRSGYSLRSARLSLELLSIEWANRGLNLWTVDGPTSVTLTPGVYRYSLPDDTVDLIEHVVRQPSSTIPTMYQDLPLDRFSVAEYAAVPNKLATGRPTVIHIRRQIHPYFVLWMVPPLNCIYQLVYWRLRRMKSLGYGGTGQPEIPWRFIPAMTAGLAYKLCEKSKQLDLNRLQLLKGEYDQEFQLAMDEDRDRASVRFVPWDYQT
jgi:hypothetical protein